MGIPGYLTMNGDGRHFIMADGILMIIWAGHGFPVMSGDRLGSIGGPAEATTVGRL